MIKVDLDDKCIICDRPFEPGEKMVDLEFIFSEPPFPFGRFVKTNNGAELRRFHKGTTYHVSCYYFRRYWGCPVKDYLMARESLLI